MENHTDRNAHPSPFVIEPTAQHTHSFILLHGLGSNGENFGKELVDTAICTDGNKLVDIFPGARFIFPTSKKQRSTTFGRAMLRQWFDVRSLDDPSYRQDGQLKGLVESSQEIREILDEESQKVAHKNIILGGLSQGCATALCCLLSLNFPLGGFIGMSGWLPFQKEIEAATRDEDDSSNENPLGSDTDDPFEHSEEKSQDIQDPIVRVMDLTRDLLCLDKPEYTSRANSPLLTPVFLGHGEADDKVKPCYGKSASETLVACGFQVTWKCYSNQGHWYKIPDEIDDLVEFIRGQVGWPQETASLCTTTGYVS